MRFFWISLFVLVAACGSLGGSGENAQAGGRADEEPPAGESPSPLHCAVNSDCQVAALSCCECATFAIPNGQGFDDSCEDVQCGDPTACPVTEARCEEGSCELACAAVTCDLACESGFVADESGCLLCECAPAESMSGCQVDTACAQTAADCCGCENGGQDTAVLSVELTGFQDGLGCPATPACPGVNTCNPSEIPRCVLGECTLAAPDGSVVDPRTYCGVQNMPTCAEGDVCVLNAQGAFEASAAYVGVCQPAP